MSYKSNIVALETVYGDKATALANIFHSMSFPDVAVEMALGIYERPEIKEIPGYSIVCVDDFSQMVTYEYTKTRTIYVESQEIADKCEAMKSSTPASGKWDNSSDEDRDFVASWNETSVEKTSIESWNKKK